jgi:hypothetical protein
MKQLILTASIFLISIAGMSQAKTAKAFFSEYDSESETYSFEEANGDYLTFNYVDKEVLTKFALKSDKLIGKSFLISYSTKVVKDEEGYEYEELTITKLQEIKLERTISDDDED